MRGRGMLQPGFYLLTCLFERHIKHFGLDRECIGHFFPDSLLRCSVSRIIGVERIVGIEKYRVG